MVRVLLFCDYFRKINYAAKSINFGHEVSTFNKRVFKFSEKTKKIYNRVVPFNIPKVISTSGVPRTATILKIFLLNQLQPFAATSFFCSPDALTIVVQNLWLSIGMCLV